MEKTCKRKAFRFWSKFKKGDFRNDKVILVHFLLDENEKQIDNLVSIW